jgi:hypothetical protein
MAKFKLGDRVTKAGDWKVRTVHEIREVPGDEALYWLQFGNEFATRIWAKESELETEPQEPTAKKPGRSVRTKVVATRKKTKVLAGQKTARRRALKRNHQPKGKGTGKSTRRK